MMGKFTLQEKELTTINNQHGKSKCKRAIKIQKEYPSVHNKNTPITSEAWQGTE